MQTKDKRPQTTDLNSDRVFPMSLLSLVFCLLSVFSSSLLAATPSDVSIVVDRMQSASNQMLVFNVSVLNNSSEDLLLPTLFGSDGDIANYTLGNYNKDKEYECLLSDSDFVILAGEKRMVRQFHHNLKDHPSPDPKVARVKISVRGVGETTIDFELQKPSLFGKIFAKTTDISLPPSSEGGGKVGESNTKSTPPLSSPLKKQGEESSPKFVTPPVFIASTPTAPSEPRNNPTPTNPVTPTNPSTPTEPTTPTNPSTPENPSTPTPPVTPTEPTVPTTPTIPVDTTPPVDPTVNSLPTYVSDPTIEVSGTKEASSSVIIDEIEVVGMDASITWNATVSLAEGTNLLRVKSKDAAGNQSGIITVSVIKDTTPPTIQNLTSGSITSNAATITLVASEPVTVVLNYQKTGDANTQTISHASSLSTHSFDLTGLTPNAEYQYFITITDRMNYTITGATQIFTTQSLGNPYEDPMVLSSNLDNGVNSVNKYSHHSLRDLNGDGIEEYLLSSFSWVVFGSTIQNTFSVVSSNPDGSYGTANTIDLSVPGFAANHKTQFAIPVGDFNGDGFEDISTAIQGDAVFLLLSDNSGANISYGVGQTIAQTASSFVGGLPLDYYQENQAADFNGDGLIDLLMASPSSGSNQSFRIINSNVGTSQYDAGAPILFNVNYSGMIGLDHIYAFSDVNADGIPEIAVVARDSGNKSYLKLLLSPVYSDPGNWIQISNAQFYGRTADLLDGLGDLDGDDLSEWMGRIGPSLEHAVLYFNSDGSVKKLQIIPSVDIEQGVRIGDLNQDGINDVALMADTGNGANGKSDEIQIFYSRGGDFDFNQPPDLTLTLASGLGAEPTAFADKGHLILRPRMAAGETKKDLVLRAHGSGPTGLVWYDIVWKEK